MDKYAAFRDSMAAAIADIRATVAHTRKDEDVDQRQAAILLTALEHVEDIGKRVVPRLSAPPIFSPPRADPPAEPDSVLTLVPSTPKHEGPLAEPQGGPGCDEPGPGAP